MAATDSMTADVYQRRAKLNQIFATDSYVIAELAARFGVSEQTIINDRRFIQTVWWAREEDAATIGEREKQAEFLKMARKEAFEAWKLSKRGREEITTRFVDSPCEACKATGTTMPGVKCFECDETGHVTEEVTFRKIDGSPGDISYLREARQCTDSICKLLGLDKPVVEKVQHHVHGDVHYTVRMKLEDKYRNADPEDVLAAKAALAKLEESAKSKTVEGTIIKREEDQE